MTPQSVVIMAILFLLHSNELHGQEATSEVNAAEKSWESILVSDDKSAYGELLADEFTWTYINGSIIDKEEAINRFRPFKVTESSKVIQLYGNTAVVSGIASLTNQGRPLKERFVRIWVRNKEGKWKVVLFQATEIR